MSKRARPPRTTTTSADPARRLLPARPFVRGSCTLTLHVEHAGLASIPHRPPFEAERREPFALGQHGPRRVRVIVDDGLPGAADALDHVLDLGFGDGHFRLGADAPARVDGR